MDNYGIETIICSLKLVRTKNDYYRILNLLHEFSTHTNLVSRYRIKVAQAFYMALQTCQELYFSDDKADQSFSLELNNNDEHVIISLILGVFNNVKAMLLDATQDERRSNSHLEIVWLLNMLMENGFDACDNNDQLYLRKIAECLLSDLQYIRFIFHIQESNRPVFPLSKLLALVINENAFISHNLKAEKIQILRLAVMMFKAEQEGSELLSHIESKCNLRFLSYLRDDTGRLVDTEDLLNYRKNGCLIFYKANEFDRRLRDVLVRSERPEYFDRNILPTGCTVEEEVDCTGATIGYFVIYTLCAGDVPLNNYHELMKNCEGRQKMLSLLFETQAKNVMMDYSIVQKNDGSIVPLNLFCVKDINIIYHSANEKNGRYCNEKDIIKKILNEYRLAPIRVSAQNAMNRVTFGLCAYLLACENIGLNELGLDELNEESWYQEQILSKWFLSDKVDSDNIYSVLKEWAKQLRFCKDGALQNAGFSKLSNCDFLPCSYNFHRLLAKIAGVNESHTSEFDGKILCGIYSKASGKVQVIENGTASCDSFEFKFLETDVFVGNQIQDQIDMDSFYFVYDSSKRIAYITDDIILRAIDLLDGQNCYFLDYSVADVVSYEYYHEAIERMELYSDAFSEIGKTAGGKCIVADSDMQLYLRLLYNMIWMRVKQDSVDKYFKIIRCHEKISFSWVSQCFFEACNRVQIDSEENGCLYVPKDKQEMDSALYSIYTRYIKTQSRRDTDFLYSRELECDENGDFCINGYKIRKIVFLEDNFVSGTATINSLSSYLGYCPPNNEMPSNIEGTLQTYQCQGRSVFVRDIVEKNHPSIGLLSFYGTEDGKKRIDGFLHHYAEDCEYCGEIIETKYLRELKMRFIEIKDEVRFFNKLKRMPNDNTCIFIREFNMPKKSGFPSAMLNPMNLICLFVKKDER